MKISEYQCYNVFSLCFFIQAFSLLFIIIFGYFIYYRLIKSNYYLVINLKH